MGKKSKKGGGTPKKKVGASGGGSPVAPLSARRPVDYIDEVGAHEKFVEANCEDASCFICLDGDDGALLRDCSCRGSAGWAHFECLVKYAKERSEPLIRSGSYRPDVLGDCWIACCNCKQEFQNDLAVAMVSSCVEFIGNHGDYTRKQWDLLEMLKIKQVKHFESHQEEGAQVSRKILSLLAEQSAATHLGPRIFEQRLLELEADTYRGLSGFCMGGEEYREVIEHSERAIEIYKKLRVKFSSDKEKYTPMIACAQTKIDEARKLMSGDESNAFTEDELEKRRIMYEADVKLYSEAEAIRTGLEYAEALQRAGYSIKAHRLSAKLHRISQQVHGPTHSLTEQALRGLFITRHRGMIFNGRHYAFVKYIEAKDKYIVRGPINPDDFEHRSSEFGQRSKVTLSSCRLYDRTPVIVHGMGSDQEHLNGKVGDTMGEDTHLVMMGSSLRVISYNVRFENGEKARFSPENLRVLFEVPQDGD